MYGKVVNATLGQLMKKNTYLFRKQPGNSIFIQLFPVVQVTKNWLKRCEYIYEKQVENTMDVHSPHM